MNSRCPTESDTSSTASTGRPCAGRYMWLRRSMTICCDPLAPLLCAMTLPARAGNPAQLFQRQIERIAFRIGERRLARRCERSRRVGVGVRTRIGGGQCRIDDRVHQAQEVALPAPMRIAVALDQARAFGDFARQRWLALERGVDGSQPALDQLLLDAITVATAAPGLEPRHR